MSKKTNKFDYPHPVIRDLYKEKSYTPENVANIVKQKPTFYDTKYTFSPSIKTHISPKLFRISNSKIVPDQKFGILMQPFCHTQEVQLFQRSNQDQENWKCKNCQSFFNHQNESLSLYEVKCKVCKIVQSISLDVKNSLENVPLCYQICSQDVKSLPLVNEKNVCFVIEASEFNHQFRVREVIESCLSSLKQTIPRHSSELQRKFSQACTEDEENPFSQPDGIEPEQIPQKTRYNISFIMFNDKHIFLINQSTNDVMVFNQSFLQGSSSSNQSVIEFGDLFRSIDEVSDQTFKMISEILYESYLKNTSCLDITTKFIQEWVDKFMVISGDNGESVKRQVEYKFFVNTLKFTKGMTSQQQVRPFANVNTGREMFSNISNMISSNALMNPSKSKQNRPSITKSSCAADQEDQSQSILTLSPNFSFFYLPHYHTTSFNSVSQKQVVKKLNNNLYKMYPQTEDQTPKSKLDLFNQIYYDLFESLSSKQYLNVKVRIVCSEKLEIIGVGNQCLGYSDTLSGLKKVNSASQNGKSFNSYTLTLNCVEPTNSLPIDLKIMPMQMQIPKTKKEALTETQHFIQISMEYSKPYLIEDQYR